MATFGEKAVGLDFNPLGDPMVRRLKELYAQIIDICHTERGKFQADGRQQEKVRLYSIAITEAQGAQMWAVKSATWKRDDANEDVP
jgi:hypothetical protein